MTRRHILTLILLLLALTGVRGQEFFNLTADDVRIDSVLPRFTHSWELGPWLEGSACDVQIEYPEFIDMTPTDVARYQRLTADTLPAMPEIEQYVGISRRQATLYVSFVPIVFRDGRFQKLVSFKLGMKMRTATRAAQFRVEAGGGDAVTGRYADHSVLASGRWAKISVAETGIHQLTDEVVRQAGFSNPSRVRIYGYGGAMQPERLTAGYLAQTDDLKEVPTCTVGGRRLFWGIGPVNWKDEEEAQRVRNPYSDKGYYLITESDDEPLTLDSETFMAAGYPSPNDYHALYEVDNFAWYHGGRQLFEEASLAIGSVRSITLPAYGEKGLLSVVLSYDGPFDAVLTVNGDSIARMNVTAELGSYSKAALRRWSLPVSNLQGSNVVGLRQKSGATVRIDYVDLASETRKPAPDLASDDFPQARYVYNITNQDHHADTAVDMVIVIPTSQKFADQAERLKQLHEEADTLRVRIVPADELFNEFSSGTPDANAYRRYMKMLYDRAQTEADMPRYLLLFGDGAWDNRMLTTNWRNTSPDDFLLCYESENSMSETDCYVTDDYYCMLDDGEGGNLLSSDKADVAVGRLTARTPAEAKVLVDKIYSYRYNDLGGAWQNTLCFMADDGNGEDQNNHMRDTETVVNTILAQDSSFVIKKIYWDSYIRQTTATGNKYPDAERLVRQQMQSGALIMNYTGHGSASQLSHEQVVTMADFKASTSLRLPFWLTASCDTSPFDGYEENLGEEAMYNKNGGAIAFLGTTRTVYENYNVKMNRAVMSNLFAKTNGHTNTFGEAVRLAKNSLITATKSENRDHTNNKLSYTLLGDPALRLAVPEWKVLIDSIDGKPVGAETITLKAGSAASVAGHIVDGADFNGMANVMVRDVEETVVCKLNYVSSADTPFRFQDRLNTLYQGNGYVTNGRFSMSFAIPKDISFSENTGQVLVFAISSDRRRSAHGHNDNFVMTGQDSESNDGVGPNIYCYLNSSSFTNGATVNATPYFYAELTDKDGINAAGSGIGHNMELTVDGQLNRTYILNEYFQYDFGDYRSGNVGYSLPELEEGTHKLQFRAWDVLNNSSVAELTFVVGRSVEPRLSSVICTSNPAITGTSFVISHDRAGSKMDVVLEIFDTSGRKLWEHAESGVSAGQAYTIDWDLTTSSGNQLQTGVYLYRVLVSCDGSSQASSAQKLIVMKK